uniref:BTB domain-containing protein n=1 Tax=Hucho hucho TaxID=62062 RepID=A0A4W5P3H0_9TELE
MGSQLQATSQDPEEAVETACASGRHGCECRKRKRTATVSLMRKMPYWTHHGGEKSHWKYTQFRKPTHTAGRSKRQTHLQNRKKLKSTSKYIYQTLFLNKNSDIRICALGQEWNLHKVYLCQVSALFCVHYTLY